MAGAAILASICAGRLTKLLVNHSKSQSHLLRKKARLTDQVMSLQTKSAPRQITASWAMPKAINYNFTSKWTSFGSDCQRFAMKMEQPNIYSLSQSKGISRDNMMSLPVFFPGVLAAKSPPLQMFEEFKVLRNALNLIKAPHTPKVLFYPSKLSGKMAQMSPTLLMGRQYTMGPRLGSCVNDQRTSQK